MDTMTDDAASQDAGLTRLHPAVRVLWWLQAALVALGTVIVAAVIDVFVGTALPWPRWLLTGAVTALTVTAAVVIPSVRYRAYSYQLRADDLWIRSGVFWRRVTVIPYIRLQFVDTRQGPVERMLGLSQLVVHTAAVGTSGTVPGLSTQAAQSLRERLAQLEGDTGGL
jgi:uncharacterized protein